jgi:hypothetical protein
MSRIALIVGIDHYEYVPCLTGCVKDARNVASVLRQHGDGRDNFEIELLTCEGKGESISNARLRTALRKLFLADADVVLFYFAGHGYNDSVGGFIEPSDTPRGDQGISLHDILALADKSSTKNKVIVLDSCHGGSMGATLPSIPAVSMLKEGTTILTASTAEQYASTEDGEGVFTRLFVDALNGAACNLKGEISPGSIYAHIDQSLFGLAQRPVFKTNVKRFISLRNVEPPIALSDLKQITALFPKANYYFNLDPSFEPERSSSQSGLIAPNRENTAKFAVLQRYNRVNLVVPVDAPHMWHAAMESKGCRLTSLGEHYRRLIQRHGIQPEEGIATA